MRHFDHFFEHQMNLARLCEMKARPPVIRDIIPKTVPDCTIYAVYKQINNISPPQGQFPREIRGFFATSAKRLQTSVILCIWERVITVVDSTSSRYIATFDQYIHVYGKDALFDFNRMWFLIRQFIQRRIALCNCSACGCRHAFNREICTDRDICPVCIQISRQNKKNMPATPSFDDPDLGYSADLVVSNEDRCPFEDDDPLPDSVHAEGDSWNFNNLFDWREHAHG